MDVREQRLALETEHVGVVWLTLEQVVAKQKTYSAYGVAMTDAADGGVETDAGDVDQGALRSVADEADECGGGAARVRRRGEEGATQGRYMGRGS